MMKQGRGLRPFLLLPEFTNIRESHSSALPIEDVKFDQGLKENFFSERVLMRSKW